MISINKPDLITLMMIFNMQLSIDDPRFSNFQWLIHDPKVVILKRWFSKNTLCLGPMFFTAQPNLNWPINLVSIK